MTTHGEINWVELQTHDPDRAMKFYAETVGWSFQPELMPTGGIYWLVMARGRPVGGILALEHAVEMRPDRWVVYFHIDRLDDAIEHAEGHGATILRRPWEVPGVGRVAMVREPGGAEVGWVTPLQQ